jgi:hypothetical protein
MDSLVIDSIRFRQKGRFALPIHGGDEASYVIINVKQKPKKEDLTNEYALENRKLVCKPLELLERSDEGFHSPEEGDDSRCHAP